MIDHIEIRVDNGDTVRIEWDSVKEGTTFTAFMARIEVAVVAAGYSQTMFDNYMREG